MAHQIDTVSLGRASYASTQREWHGLGELLPRGADLDTWARSAGMEYSVQRAFPRYATERGVTDVNALKVYDEKVILFRSDTGAPLGCVSPKYKVVQPREMLEFFTEWAVAGGMTLESAGVLFGGKRYFATAKLSDAVAVDGAGGRDRIVPYALLSTSADGTLATEARWTSVRVVCNNTLRLASADAAAFKLSHRSEWKPEAARDTIEAAQAEFGAFMQTARALAAVKVESRLAEEMTMALLRKGTEDADKVKETAGFNKIMALFNGQAQGATLETARETAFGWLNACTEYFDHHVRAHNDENRMASALWGQGDDMKQKALAVALAA